VDGRDKPGHDAVLVRRRLGAASRLLQKLRPQHQALDLVGAAFDFVRVGDFLKLNLVGKQIACLDLC
jgi:hypothetical protein